jgi:hypothetical protein
MGIVSSIKLGHMSPQASIEAPRALTKAEQFGVAGELRAYMDMHKPVIVCAVCSCYVSTAQVVLS